MKTLKLAVKTFPFPFKIDDDSYVLHRFPVKSGPFAPAQFVLAAGRQPPGEDFESGNFGRDVDLSEYYRTEQAFDDALKNGFPISDAFFEMTDAARILAALTKQGLATITPA